MFFFGDGLFAQESKRGLKSADGVFDWYTKLREDGVIPVASWIDGAWYRGKGRTASVAVWDAHNGTFHTVGMNTYRDPATFPVISNRVTRLKQEGHVETSGGPFAPLHILAAE